MSQYWGTSPNEHFIRSATTSKRKARIDQSPRGSTLDQREALRRAFQAENRPGEEHIQLLAKETGLSEESVKGWFDYARKRLNKRLY